MTEAICIIAILVGIGALSVGNIPLLGLCAGICWAMAQLRY